MQKAQKLQGEYAEPDYFVVTTGTGRQGKAHFPGDKNFTVCGKAGKNLKKVDAETVERFYSICKRCRAELKKINSRSC